MKIFRLVLLFLASLVVILLEGDNLSASWRSNLTNIYILQGREVVASSSCANNWLAGMSAGRHGDQHGQYQASTEALHCSVDYLPLIRAVYPKDQSLAELSTQLYPDSTDAWFWFGEVLSPGDMQGARQAYIHAVELAPRFGLAWCRLGGSYGQTGDLEESANAYFKCCLSGDPGMNGCYRAGLVMEQMGNIPQAIIYYRYSNFDKALDRADELERQFNP